MMTGNRLWCCIESSSWLFLRREKKRIKGESEYITKMKINQGVQPQISHKKIVKSRNRSGYGGVVWHRHLAGSPRLKYCAAKLFRQEGSTHEDWYSVGISGSQRLRRSGNV